MTRGTEIERPEKRLKSTHAPHSSSIYHHQSDLNDVKAEPEIEVVEESVVEIGEVTSKASVYIKEPAIAASKPDTTGYDSDDNVIVKKETITVKTDEGNPTSLKTKVVNEADMKLFESCKDGSDVGIQIAIDQGANPEVLNEKDQYPIHVWMYKIARKVNMKSNHLKKAFKSMELLLPSKSTLALLDSLDSDFSSPLSLGIIGDVRSWCIIKGLFNPAHEYQLPEKLNDIKIQQSAITSKLIRWGGTLKHLKRNEMTPWHHIASTVYSAKDSNQTIAGFSVEKDTKLLILSLALIIRDFRMIGKMDLNTKDKLGRTGLDILSERFELEDVDLSEEDFEMLIGQLKEAGCK
jgi:hypothetical protein